MIKRRVPECRALVKADFHFLRIFIAEACPDWCFSVIRCPSLLLPSSSTSTENLPWGPAHMLFASYLKVSLLFSVLSLLISDTLSFFQAKLISTDLCAPSDSGCSLERAAKSFCSPVIGSLVITSFLFCGRRVVLHLVTTHVKFFILYSFHH